MADHLFVILRGLPGSGKSTYAKQIAACAAINRISCVICSTDDFFGKSGTYKFQAESLQEAHAWNLSRCSDAFREKINVVVLDNTNIKRKHFAPYVELAKLAEYDIREDVIGKFDDSAILQGYWRGTHGVPLITIKAMAMEFEP